MLVTYWIWVKISIGRERQEYVARIDWPIGESHSIGRTKWTWDTLEFDPQSDRSIEVKRFPGDVQETEALSLFHLSATRGAIMWQVGDGDAAKKTSTKPGPDLGGKLSDSCVLNPS
ncbi:hypothetical protein CBL_08667 [Carabus blaptoides fortunei]